jgi:threonine synthase
MIRDAKCLWDFKRLLPVQDYRSIVSLGEGGTPLFLARGHLRRGPGELLIKDETRNPTGSFKDRAISVIVSKARECGVKHVITASSGNAGVSLAAYGAAGGLTTTVVVPRSVAREKLAALVCYGVEVLLVDGTYSDAYTLAKKIAAERRWVNATTTFLNPYGLEGYKTIAYEIVRDMRFQSPDWVMIPIGSGPLLVGCYKGFNELKKYRIIDSVPAFIGVQAEGCAPIVRAFREKALKVTAWGNPRTIAEGIADPLVGYERDGSLTLEVTRKSGGVMVSVTDDEIMTAVLMLARECGLFAEPAGAAAVAGYMELAREGFFGSDAKVVCVITGSGFKNLQAIEKSIDLTPVKHVDESYGTELWRISPISG